jgi:putative FmdB family regulatory protein
MPLYDFHCPACDNAFERLVRRDEVPACPACGHAAPERRIGAPAAPGTSTGVLARARSAAAREGHFSNYSRAERGKIR